MKEGLEWETLLLGAELQVLGYASRLPPSLADVQFRSRLIE